jgi:hypothetical protein
MRKECKTVAWSEGGKKLTVLRVDGTTILKKIWCQTVAWIEMTQDSAFSGTLLYTQQ